MASNPMLLVNMYKRPKVCVEVLAIEAVAPLRAGVKAGAAGPTEVMGLMEALGLMEARPTFKIQSPALCACAAVTAAKLKQRVSALRAKWGLAMVVVFIRYSFLAPHIIRRTPAKTPF